MGCHFVCTPEILCCKKENFEEMCSFNNIIVRGLQIVIVVFLNVWDPWHYVCCCYKI